MRVLHVTDAYLPRLGGIEMHVHDLARAQAEAGDEVDIITMTRGRGALDAPGSAMVIRPRDEVGHDRQGALLVQQPHVRRRPRLRHRACTRLDRVLLSFFAMGTNGVPRLITVHSLWRRYTPLYRASTTV